MFQGDNFLCIKGEKKDICLVVFSSRRGLRPEDGYEFLKTRKKLGWSGIFIYDPKKSWYLKGVPGLGNNVDEIAEKLKYYVSQLEAKYIIVMGFSQGGYASILYGPMIGSHVILAFSPQTYLDRDKRARFGEDRWPESEIILYKECKGEQKYFDLLRFYNNTPVFSWAHIFFCRQNIKDRKQAVNISKFPWVKLEYLDCEAHNTAAQFFSETHPISFVEMLQMTADRYFGTFFPSPDITKLDEIKEITNIHQEVWEEKTYNKTDKKFTNTIKKERTEKITSQMKRVVAKSSE